MSDYMLNVLSLLESRRSGVISNSQFLMKTSRCIFGEYTDRHCLALDPIPSSVEDTAMIMNKNVSAYDVGYLDNESYGLVATWNPSTCLKSWRSNGCVRWGLESSVASVSGQGNNLIILDTTVFDVAKVFSIHGVSNIFVHSHNPRQLGVVAVGSDADSVPIIDLRIPHTNYIHKRSSAEPIRCLEWSPFREHQFLTATTNEIFLWDMRSPQSIQLSNIIHGKKFVQRAMFLDAYQVTAVLQSNLIQILDFSQAIVKINGSIEHVSVRNFQKSFKFIINTFSKPNLLYLPTYNHMRIIELEPPFNLIYTIPNIIDVRLLEYNSGTNEIFAFSDYSAEILCPKYYWQ